MKDAPARQECCSRADSRSRQLVIPTLTSITSRNSQLVHSNASREYKLQEVPIALLASPGKGQSGRGSTEPPCPPVSPSGTATGGHGAPRCTRHRGAGKAQPMQQLGPDPTQPQWPKRSLAPLPVATLIFLSSPKPEALQPRAPPGSQPTATWPLARSEPRLLSKGDVTASLKLNKSISHINTIKFRFWGRELGRKLVKRK